MRVLESLDAAGCTTWQKIRYGILPQLMPNFASTAIYRFDINLRDATVLGLVGAGGIGAPLIFAMNAYRWEEAGAILAGLIVLVLIVEWISTKSGSSWPGGNHGKDVSNLLYFRHPRPYLPGELCLQLPGKLRAC